MDSDRADSRLAPSQWETLQSNAVSHWLGANLELALSYMFEWVKNCYWREPLVDLLRPGEATLWRQTSWSTPGWVMTCHRHQAIISTDADVLSNKPKGTSYGEILCQIQVFMKNVFENVVCKMAAIFIQPKKWQPFSLSQNKHIEIMM